MDKIGGRFCFAACLVGLFTASGVAQTALISVKAVTKNPQCFLDGGTCFRDEECDFFCEYAPNPQNVISANPGDVILAEIYISDWDVDQGKRLRALQVSLTGMIDGLSGILEVITGDRDCNNALACQDVGTDCLGGVCTNPCTQDFECNNIGAVCNGGPNCDTSESPLRSVFMDTQRADYAYAGVLTQVPALDVSAVPSLVRYANTVQDPNRAPIYEAPPKYFGSFGFRGSTEGHPEGEACGQFVITPTVLIRDRASVEIPHTVEPLTINFPACVGVCGDGVKDSGEECDGDDDEMCPGHCQPDCTCLPIECGNNKKQEGEECDGTDDDMCPGECLPPGDPRECECQLPPGESIGSFPPACSVDARQPTNPDGSNPQGWQNIRIDFSAESDVLGLAENDFTLREVPPVVPPVNPNFITGLNVNNATKQVTVFFNRRMTTERWTCVRYNGDPEGVEYCLGYLPGNVNGDGSSVPNDILAEINCLNNVAPCAIWQCDVDRSNVCAPQDVLREIDLLNGASQFRLWNNASIPACPAPQ